MFTRAFSSCSIARLSTKAGKTLSVEKMNPLMRDAQYAVRGELVLRSLDHARTLERGDVSSDAALPFDKIVACNIGNPQEVGQMPISFPRQVLALTTCPELLNEPAFVNALPKDVVTRAKKYLSEIPSGTGAYSHSKGVEVVRKEVADFITERDGGHPANPEHIFLTDGASPAVQMGLKALIAHEKVGIMIPIPQYPLYSASIALNGGRAVGYYLNEESDWSTDLEELERALKEAQKLETDVRAVAVINPGNPTGQIMSVESMEEVLAFCQKESLVLLADEVYQENIWLEGESFTSFKKVLRDMEDRGALPPGEVELLSFHSVSKGFYGECGRRGGYVEFVNVDEDSIDEFYKLASISLCSNLDGQLMMGLMVQPPKDGDDSYGRYIEERNNILDSLKRRATLIVDGLNDLEGIDCNATQGALYAFPQIELPAAAVKDAEKAGKAPDAMYCLELLDATGIVVVPGSGFGQVDGTWHFRTTILPQEEDMGDVVVAMRKFHEGFMEKYRG